MENSVSEQAVNLAEEAATQPTEARRRGRPKGSRGGYTPKSTPKPGAGRARDLRNGSYVLKAFLEDLKVVSERGHGTALIMLPYRELMILLGRVKYYSGSNDGPTNRMVHFLRQRTSFIRTTPEVFGLSRKTKRSVMERLHRTSPYDTKILNTYKGFMLVLDLCLKVIDWEAEQGGQIAIVKRRELLNGFLEAVYPEVFAAGRLLDEAVGNLMGPTIIVMRRDPGVGPKPTLPAVALDATSFYNLLHLDVNNAYNWQKVSVDLTHDLRDRGGDATKEKSIVWAIKKLHVFLLRYNSQRADLFIKSVLNKLGGIPEHNAVLKRTTTMAGGVVAQVRPHAPTP